MERVFASFYINLRFQKHQRSVRASQFLWRSQTKFFWFNEISSLNCRRLIFPWKSFTNNIMPKEIKKENFQFLTFKAKRYKPEVQFYTCSVQNWVIIPYFARRNQLQLKFQSHLCEMLRLSFTRGCYSISSNNKPEEAAISWACVSGLWHTSVIAPAAGSTIKSFPYVRVNFTAKST